MSACSTQRYVSVMHGTHFAAKSKHLLVQCTIFESILMANNPIDTLNIPIKASGTGG
jgi:hypothetical protein